jgi:rRNA maturation endonuclease Nob1
MRTVSFKISEKDYKKLLDIRGDKPVSTYLRELIQREWESHEEDVRATAELIAKLENADISKIADKTDQIISILRGMNTQDDGKIERLALAMNVKIEELAKKLIPNEVNYKFYLDACKDRLAKLRGEK